MFKFDIDNGLVITRGDDGGILLKSTATDDETNNKGWEATLSVKKNLRDKEYVFQTEADENGLFYISPENSKCFTPGKYEMDIEYRENGHVSTLGVWPFIVLPDVTRHPTDIVSITDGFWKTDSLGDITLADNPTGKSVFAIDKDDDVTIGGSE